MRRLLFYLGETDKWANQTEAAINSYRNAISCAPAYGEAYLALGTALQAQSKDAEALRALRRAAELLPQKSEAHFQLARALAKAGLAAQSPKRITESPGTCRARGRCNCSGA